MAIDTKSLTQIITEFRKLSAKDSITPESLGYILQRIADLLATAGTSETQAILGTWYNSLSKVDHTAVCKLQQGSADRNFVRLSNTFIDLLTGQQMTNENATIINMATTERAGAMKAQQVVDLNNARHAIADIEKLLDVIQTKLGMTEGSKGLYNTAQISCVVQNGQLHVLGAQQLIADGYVPYIFRPVRKRNPYKDKDATAEMLAAKKYCSVKKGWGVFGSLYAVKLNGTQVMFSTGPHNFLCIEKQPGYSGSPEYFVSHSVDKAGNRTFGWGRTSVHLLDSNLANTTSKKKERMIRLRFGIGFAKPIYPGRAAITPANLASSLAEFYLIYNPATEKWTFGK